MFSSKKVSLIKPLLPSSRLAATLGKVWINFFSLKKLSQNTESLLVVLIQIHYYREGTRDFFWRAIECDSHSFANVAHFVFLRDVWIRTHAESCCGKQMRYKLSHPCPYLANHLPT
jgi:hypothetical protein